MSELTRQDVRTIWGIIPPDCKDALSRLKLLGKVEEAREWIIAEAEASLKRHPDPRNIDHFWAMELSAEQWLKARGL